MKILKKHVTIISTIITKYTHENTKETHVTIISTIITKYSHENTKETRHHNKYHNNKIHT